MNGQRTLRISTVSKAKNHPILGLLFLPFFSSVITNLLFGICYFWRIFLFFWLVCTFFTSSLILSNRILLLHLRIPISSASLLLPFIPSFIISTWLFMLHLHILISSASLLITFTYSFVTSTITFLLHLRIPIYYYSLLIDSIHFGILALKFELEVLLFARIVRIV